MTVFPIMVLVCGFCSGIVGGLVSDKFGKKTPMMKSLVCVIGNTLAMPMFITAMLLKNNFWLSVSLIGCRYLVGETWKSPNITMV